jgi:hypothetical protein
VSTLEQTYRRTLRWYPKRWRASNEDAVVGTLLDRAEDEHRDRPARGELGDLRSNAVLSRLGPLGRIPTSIRDRAAALGFGLGAGIAIVALIALGTEEARIPQAELGYFTLVGPFVGYSFVFYAVWILSLVSALLGGKWLARSLATAATVVSIVLHVGFGRQLLAAPTTTTIILLGLLALMSFVGNPFATRRGRTWIALASGGWAAFIGVTLWYQFATKGGAAGSTDWFVGTLWLWLQFAVPLALILAFVLRSTRRSPWWGAIVLLLVPITGFVIFGWDPRSDETVDRATLQLIMIAVVCAVYFGLLLLRARYKLTRPR